MEENEIIWPEPGEEKLREKEKRAISRQRQRNRERRLYNKLLYVGYKPSIGLRWRWDEETEEVVYTGRIYRGKNSRMQQKLKKASNQAVRRIPLDEWPMKGGRYRRAFDYWWLWI